MDAIERAAKALKPLSDEGIEVYQGWYNGDLNKTHITLWLYDNSPSGHSDDEIDVETSVIQVNVWSDRDRPDLTKRIRQYMKAEGFEYTGKNDESDPEAGRFTNAMRFNITEETEE